MSVIKIRQLSVIPDGSSPVSVPPPELMEYGEASDVHLANGKADYEAMKKALLSVGYDISWANRILDFGCSNGRVTRWFAQNSHAEIWGSDLQAAKVIWAMEHLGPRIKFLINSAVPHIPFPDGYFSYINAMSVFTHLQESHVAWLLELCRVLAPGGCFYLTLHDRDTLNPNIAPRAKILLEKHFKGITAIAPDLDDVGFISMNPYNNGALAQVYMSKEHLSYIIPRHIEIAGAIPRAYSDL